MMNIRTDPWVGHFVKMKTSYTDRLWWRGGIYFVEMHPVISFPYEIPPQISDWIKNNIRAYCRHSHKDIFIMKFRRESDVLAFKLRWYE